MIIVRANARNATYISDDIVTSGSVGIPVTFVLSEDFDGLAAIAVFEGSGTARDVALIGNTCVVPHEVVATAGGYLRIGIYASNSAGTIVIPTVWAGSKMILQGTEPSEVDPSEPTPSWAAQVQEAAAEALANSDEAIEIAGGADAAAEEARQSASAAAASATAAGQSASAAGTAQAAAEAAQTAAASARDSAVAAQGSAESSAQTAAGSASAAAGSAAAAAASEAAAREVQESIPEDYADLSADVVDLKSQTNEIGDIKLNLISDIAGLPFTCNVESSANMVTLFNTFTIDNATYVGLVHSKYYVSAFFVKINSADTSTVGTLRLANIKKNTPSTEPTTILSRQDVYLATAEKNASHFIWNISTVSEATEIYYKAVVYSGGTNARTYNMTLSNVYCFEFDSQTEAEDFVSLLSECNQSGYFSAVDKIARADLIAVKNTLNSADIVEQKNVIDCLGDSHTGGVSTFTPYPSVLKSLINDDFTVNNFGGGGNGASDITAMQGALYAVCGPCTIVDSQSYTDNVPLAMYNGDPLKQFGLRWRGINKDALTGDLNCKLGERPVYVSYDASHGFRARPVQTGGGDIVISLPTKITTTYMQTDFKSHILVLCMGANDAASVAIQDLAAWNQLIAKQYNRFIVVSEPTKISAESRAEYNKLMYSYFGTHYIDIHAYMVKYGLTDAGITPTDADEAAMLAGNTPPSLMYDNVHYNQYGTNVMAQQIYKKGVELGYWD